MLKIIKSKKIYKDFTAGILVYDKIKNNNTYKKLNFIVLKKNTNQL